MSEIAKCPLCGNTASLYEDSEICFDGEVECRACGFRCCKRDYDKISAAMECAEHIVWACECEDQKDYMDDTTSNRDAWRSIVNLDLEANEKACAAQDRVLEVFK